MLVCECVWLDVVLISVWVLGNFVGVVILGIGVF